MGSDAAVTADSRPTYNITLTLTLPNHAEYESHNPIDELYYIQNHTPHHIRTEHPTTRTETTLPPQTTLHLNTGSHHQYHNFLLPTSPTSYTF